MSLKIALVAALTALLIAIGQLLFKLGANQVDSGSLPGFVYAVFTTPIILAACVLYAATTVIWIWVLNHAPLSLAYPFTALTYVITPLLGYFVLNDKIDGQYLLGTAFLVIGIVICSLSRTAELGS